jgi:hypothetical protein
VVHVVDNAGTQLIVTAGFYNDGSANPLLGVAQLNANITFSDGRIGPGAEWDTLADFYDESVYDKGWYAYGSFLVYDFPPGPPPSVPEPSTLLLSWASAFSA